MTRVDSSGQSWTYVDTSYCYEVAYTEWVDQGSYCDLDGNVVSIGYWNNVDYWVEVDQGYWKWVDDGGDYCDAGGSSGGDFATAPEQLSNAQASIDGN